MLDRAETEVCDVDPGFPVDIYIAADTLAMHRIWMGRMQFADAVQRGLLELHGLSDLVAQFPSWLALSAFAGIAAAPEPVRG